MKRTVFKLGGSVLTNEWDYFDHARRIKELSNEVNRIYLVVSAQKGITDKLVASSNLDDKSKASFLLQGEITSARKLFLYLKHLRVNTGLLTQGSGLYPIIANSSYLDAEVHLSESLDRREVLDSLSAKVVVISGFGAENNLREPVLLGRNSSDLVASLIARIDCKVDEVVYIKDVPGIYDSDGKVISSMNLAEATKFNFGKLLHQKVLDYACCDLRIRSSESLGSLIRY